MIILMIIVVIGRYCFNSVPAWSEELSLFFMSWLGFLGAAIVEKNKGHIRVSVIDNYYPHWLLCVCNTLRYFIKLAFGVFLTFYGYKLSTTVKGYYASVEVPKKYGFIPGFIAGLLITVFLVLRFKSEVIDIWKEPAEKESGNG